MNIYNSRPFLSEDGIRIRRKPIAFSSDNTGFVSRTEGTADHTPWTVDSYKTLSPNITPTPGENAIFPSHVEADAIKERLKVRTTLATIVLATPKKTPDDQVADFLFRSMAPGTAATQLNEELDGKNVFAEVWLAMRDTHVVALKDPNTGFLNINYCEPAHRTGESKITAAELTSMDFPRHLNKVAERFYTAFSPEYEEVGKKGPDDIVLLQHIAEPLD